MKALTVIQPWASLIASGFKRYETRSWATSHRGLLAIHAGVKQNFTAETEWLLGNYRAAGEFAVNKLYSALHPMWHLAKWLYLKELGVAGANVTGKPIAWPLPFGAVLCVCELTDCVLMDAKFIAAQPAHEIAAGDWTPGRYAWELKVAEVFDPPIRTSGKQGLWEWVKP